MYRCPLLGVLHFPSSVLAFRSSISLPASQPFGYSAHGTDTCADTTRSEKRVLTERDAPTKEPDWIFQESTKYLNHSATGIITPHWSTRYSARSVRRLHSRRGRKKSKPTRRRKRDQEGERENRLPARDLIDPWEITRRARKKQNILGKNSHSPTYAEAQQLTSSKHPESSSRS